MKPSLALSIRQPWAWLIIHYTQAPKDIENRDWATKYRGLFYVHASRTFDFEGHAWIRQHFPHIPLPNAGVATTPPIFPADFNYKLGGLIGSVELTDCVTKSASPWFFGPYGFVLANPKPLPFHMVRGMPGFFQIDDPYTGENLS